MSAEVIVQFCSPTMAGLKVANLFSYRYQNKSQVMRYIAYYNNLLNERGLYFRILKCKDGVALIYVYRKRKLQEILANSNVCAFLMEYGYTDTSMDTCLRQLESHLLHQEFPHEIGIFLGYPLSDVIAFIKHKGQGHKSTGCWKVYSNEEEAKALFRKYDKCSRVYYETYQQGAKITQLTVVV